MADTSLRPRRPGRARTLVLGGLLLAGLCGAFRMAGAQQQTDPNKEAKEGTGKNAAKAPPAPPAPAPLKMVIVSDEPDVAQVSKVINDKLAESWKANKITPSGYID